jgi:hypothetical protein
LAETMEAIHRITAINATMTAAHNVMLVMVSLLLRSSAVTSSPSSTSARRPRRKISDQMPCTRQSRAAKAASAEAAFASFDACCGSRTGRRRPMRWLQPGPSALHMPAAAPAWP